MFSKPLKFHKSYASPYNNNNLTLLATIIIGSNRLYNCEHKIGLTIHYKEKNWCFQNDNIFTRNMMLPTRNSVFLIIIILERTKYT